METSSFEAAAPSNPIDTSEASTNMQPVATPEEVQAIDQERAAKKEERTRVEDADRQQEQASELPKIEQAIEQSDAPDTASTEQPAAKAAELSNQERGLPQEKKEQNAEEMLAGKDPAKMTDFARELLVAKVMMTTGSNVEVRNGAFVATTPMDKMERFMNKINGVMQFLGTFSQKLKGIFEKFEKKEEKQLKLSSQEIRRELPRVISEFKNGNGNMAALNVLYMHASQGMKGYIESIFKNQIEGKKMIGGSTVALEATRYGRLFVVKHPDGSYNTGLNHDLLEVDPTFVEKPREAQPSAPASSPESAVQAAPAAPVATATATTPEQAEMDKYIANLHAETQQWFVDKQAELRQQDQRLDAEMKTTKAEIARLEAQRDRLVRTGITTPDTPTSQPDSLDKQGDSPSAETDSTEQTSETKVPNDPQIAKDIIDGQKFINSNVTITSDIASQILKEGENLGKKDIDLGNATIDPEAAHILGQFGGDIRIQLKDGNMSGDAIKELGKVRKLRVFGISNNTSYDMKTALMELGGNVEIFTDFPVDTNLLKEFQDSKCEFVIKLDTVTPEAAQLLAARKGRTMVLNKNRTITPEAESILRTAKGPMMLNSFHYGPNKLMNAYLNSAPWIVSKLGLD